MCDEENSNPPLLGYKIPAEVQSPKTASGKEWSKFIVSAINEYEATVAVANHSNVLEVDRLGIERVEMNDTRPDGVTRAEIKRVV